MLQPSAYTSGERCAAHRHALAALKRVAGRIADTRTARSKFSARTRARAIATTRTHRDARRTHGTHPHKVCRARRSSAGVRGVGVRGVGMRGVGMRGVGLPRGAEVANRAEDRAEGDRAEDCADEQGDVGTRAEAERAAARRRTGLRQERQKEHTQRTSERADAAQHEEAQGDRGAGSAVTWATAQGRRALRAPDLLRRVVAPTS